MPEANIQSVEIGYAGGYGGTAATAAARGSFPKRVLFRQRYRLLQFMVDSLALAAAWFLTLEARLLLNGVVGRELGRAELVLLAPSLGTIWFVWMMVALYRRSYRSRAVPGLIANWRETAESALVAAAVTVIVTFFSRQFGANLSRSFVFLFTPLSLLALSAARYTALAAVAVCEKRWPLFERVAVLGQGSAASDVAEQLFQAGTSAGICGVVLPRGGGPAGLRASLPVLGRTAELGALINQHGLERLVIVDGQLSPEEMEDCARISKRMGVIASRAFGLVGHDSRLEVTESYGLRLLELRPLTFTRRAEVAKRALDIVVSASLLLLLSPLLGVLAFLVKLSSEGPALYKSSRVGKGGRHFTFLKFRSMVAQGQDHSASRQHLHGSNQQNGHLFKIRDDPRVTPIGKFLRRSSLDEMPQLINVLLGQMSLVGPRPLPAEDLDPDGHSQQFGEWAEKRSRVLPGITGLWQVSGRSELSFEKMVELDARYVSDCSLALDLRILLQTPLAVLSARGAY
jgi:exopolysaccharide biosynthesis polyprenyl glycosylphosphotransferase